MTTELDIVQSEFLSLVPSTVDFQKQRNEMVTESFELEDVIVMMLILKSFGTEQVALVLTFLYSEKFCIPLEGKNKQIVYDPVSEQFDIVYKNSSGKKIEISGDLKTVYRHFETSLEAYAG